MRNVEMPMPGVDQPESSPFAGKDPEYSPRSVVRTKDGETVVIVNYDKAKGVYHVTKMDKEGVVSPIYRLSPDALSPLEEKEE